MTVYFEIVGFDGLKVLYRSPGSLGTPAVLSPHDLQSASRTFHDLIPDPVGTYRVIALDLHGFGMIEQPARDFLANIFNNIAGVVSRFTEVFGLEWFAFYVFDHCAPVGSLRA